MFLSPSSGKISGEVQSLVGSDSIRSDKCWNSAEESISRQQMAPSLWIFADEGKTASEDEILGVPPWYPKSKQAQDKRQRARADR